MKINRNDIIRLIKTEDTYGHCLELLIYRKEAKVLYLIDDFIFKTLSYEDICLESDILEAIVNDDWSIVHEKGFYNEMDYLQISAEELEEEASKLLNGEFKIYDDLLNVLTSYPQIYDFLNKYEERLSKDPMKYLHMNMDTISDLGEIWEGVEIAVMDLTIYSLDRVIYT